MRIYDKYLPITSWKFDWSTRAWFLEARYLFLSASFLESFFSSKDLIGLPRGLPDMMRIKVGKQYIMWGEERRKIEEKVGEWNEVDKKDRYLRHCRENSQ